MSRIARIDGDEITAEDASESELTAVKETWEGVLRKQKLLKDSGLPRGLAAQMAFDEVVLERLQKRKRS